jgi:hypothetical protein
LTNELVKHGSEFGIRSRAESQASFDVAERDAAICADKQIIDRLFSLTTQPFERCVSG